MLIFPPELRGTDALRAVQSVFWVPPLAAEKMAKWVMVPAEEAAALSSAPELLLTEGSAVVADAQAPTAVRATLALSLEPFSDQAI
jgi:hypothetical protein